MPDSPLICAEEALKLFNSSTVRFVDATWFLPNVPTSSHAAYLEEHLPGAVYFDIDKVADGSNNLPHMFPTQAYFEQCVGEMGISVDDTLVVYDRSKFVASARVWWMFLSFGHENVKVLNGGLAAWKKVGGRTECGQSVMHSATYSGKAVGDSVILYDDLVSKIGDTSIALLDARSPGRYSGEEPEPRPGLRGGHIPSSQNLYYGNLLDADDKIKSSNEVNALLEELLVDSEKNIVTTCGSGVTAAIILLAIYQFRQNGLSLYDGSWTEWALNPKSPI